MSTGKPTHTPGPWHRDPDWATHIKAGEREVATVAWTMDDESGVEAVANGNLIAAAPDMLRVAQSALHRLAAMEMLPEFQIELEAAIAKAEGRP